MKKLLLSILGVAAISSVQAIDYDPFFYFSNFAFDGLPPYIQSDSGIDYNCPGHKTWRQTVGYPTYENSNPQSEWDQFLNTDESSEIVCYLYKQKYAPGVASVGSVTFDNSTGVPIIKEFGQTQFHEKQNGFSLRINNFSPVLAQDIVYTPESYR